MLLALPGRGVAQHGLPDPSGPYGVGTVRLTLVDSSRTDPTHPESNSPRRLVVQVWYPAATSGAGTRLAPYIPELAQLEADLAEAYPGVRFDTLMTRAVWDAPSIPGRRFPLVVFSHGMNTMRVFYTALVQDLASHGFVVAAIDHPFWTVAAVFPDGSRQRLADGMAVRAHLTSDQIDGFMEDGVRAMAADQAFVAARLSTTLPRFSRSIDPARIGAMGHSMGGMAATQACWTYRIFSSCVSLDGIVWTREGFAAAGEPPNPVAKPFLLLVAPQFLPADRSVLRDRYRQAWGEPSICLVRGSRHNSVTDLPELLGSRPAAGELDPLLAGEAFRQAVVAFFSATLLGASSAPTADIDSVIGPLPGDSMPCRVSPG